MAAGMATAATMTTTRIRNNNRSASMTQIRRVNLKAGPREPCVRACAAGARRKAAAMPNQMHSASAHAARTGPNSGREFGRGRTLRCSAAQPETGGDKSIAGMDTSRGYFGFVPFSELFVGRWAMMGFASGLFVELATGKGILKQIGIQTPSTPIFIALAALIGGSTLVASGATVARLLSGSMSEAEVRDYASFLGLKGESRSTKKTSSEMKAKGDFTSFQDLDELERIRSETVTAADTFLSQDSADDIGDAKNALGASSSGVVAESGADAADPIDSYFARSEAAEAAYAKDVELTNGRWAMIGFATAILVEAATGQGIIGQLIQYGKLSGLLGDMSGF